jgi:hypothetical protein
VTRSTKSGQLARPLVGPLDDEASRPLAVPSDLGEHRGDELPANSQGGELARGSILPPGIRKPGELDTEFFSVKDPDRTESVCDLPHEPRVVARPR